MIECGESKSRTLKEIQQVTKKPVKADHCRLTIKGISIIAGRNFVIAAIPIQTPAMNGLRFLSWYARLIPTSQMGVIWLSEKVTGDHKASNIVTGTMQVTGNSIK